MKLKYLITTSIVAVLAATSAQAADSHHFSRQVSSPVAKVQSASLYDWSGAYVGLETGGAGSYYKDSTGDSPKKYFSPLSVYAGYNVDFSNNFIGGVDVSAATKVSSDDTGVKLDNVTMRIRAGYELGRFLPYVAAGLSTSKFTNLADKSKYTVAGTTIGAGIEYGLSNNVVLKSEYQFVKHYLPADKESISHINTNIVLFGVAYKF